MAVTGLLLVGLLVYAIAPYVRRTFGGSPSSGTVRYFPIGEVDGEGGDEERGMVMQETSLPTSLTLSLPPGTRALAL